MNAWVQYTLISSAKVFISSTTCICLQRQDVCPKHKMCSSLAINMFVSSVIRIWRLVPETISSLVTKPFICSAKSCSAVSSRDCLITSNKRFVLLFGSWFRNPQNEQKIGGDVSEKRSFQVRAGPVKGQKQGRDEQTQ